MQSAEESQAGGLERELLSPTLEPLLRWLSMQREGLHAGAPTPDSVEWAVRQGWVVSADGESYTLTELGSLAIDSLREFVLWEQRQRRLHGEGRLRDLDPRAFRGKRVLELGCGSGINLLSLQSEAASVLGLDVEPRYLELGRTLARAHGLEPPAMLVGRGEDTGLPDASFDFVVIFGALQYMCIEAVIREVARLLGPGGKALFVLAEWRGSLRRAARALRSEVPRPHLLARTVRQLLGSAVYPWLGRALLRPHAPVYVSMGRMRRWLRAAGLEHDAEGSGMIGEEACYVASKPQARS